MPCHAASRVVPPFRRMTSTRFPRFSEKSNRYKIYGVPHQAKKERRSNDDGRVPNNPPTFPTRVIKAMDQAGFYERIKQTKISERRTFKISINVSHSINLTLKFFFPTLSEVIYLYVISRFFYLAFVYDFVRLYHTLELSRCLHFLHFFSISPLSFFSTPEYIFIPF